MPFPIACINWHRGCKYKTRRGISTKKQVLQVLEQHKRLCKKRVIGKKASGSNSEGFLKPSPSEVCVGESLIGVKKCDPGEDGDMQVVKSEQTF